MLSKYLFDCMDAPSSGSLCLSGCQQIAIRGAEKQILDTRHEAAQVLRQKMKPTGRVERGKNEPTFPWLLVTSSFCHILDLKLIRLFPAIPIRIFFFFFFWLAGNTGLIGVLNNHTGR